MFLNLNGDCSRYLSIYYCPTKIQDFLLRALIFFFFLWFFKSCKIGLEKSIYLPNLSLQIKNKNFRIKYIKYGSRFHSPSFLINLIILLLCQFCTAVFADGCGTYTYNIPCYAHISIEYILTGFYTYTHIFCLTPENLSVFHSINTFE